MSEFYTLNPKIDVYGGGVIGREPKPPHFTTEGPTQGHPGSLEAKQD